MNSISDVQSKLETLLFTNQPEYQVYDALQAGVDSDYMMYSPLVNGYTSVAEQRFLFQNVLIGFDATKYSILDIGCGRGDLYGYLHELTDNNIFSYAGIDHNPNLVELASKRYDLTVRTVAYETLSNQKADWVVAINVFTQRKCETESADLIKLYDDIKLLYNCATQCVSFNLLSPINANLQPGQFYVHPGLILDMLLERYKFVTIRHNYATNIYTVTIYKF
jgi:SAM-dependent methyltransferase